MVILVDYDNIDKNILRLGILYVINKIVSKIHPSEVSNSRHITVRLYGGWYDHNRFTIRAQNLSADIALSFPNTSILSDNRTSVIINCEIAYSLLADPTNHLLYTYRTKGIPTGLKARRPNSCGCSTLNCPIDNVFHFVNNKICNQCSVLTPEDIFYRGEQKLIDTMLTSDLIYSANRLPNLCVVSSDDDFWPGIMTALSLGKKIVQIHTSSRPTPAFYTQNAGSNYTQKHL